MTTEHASSLGFLASDNDQSSFFEKSGLDPDMTVDELREAVAIRAALLKLRWDDPDRGSDSWEPESAYDMERMLWQFARGELR